MRGPEKGYAKWARPATSIKPLDREGGKWAELFVASHNSEKKKGEKGRQKLYYTRRIRLGPIET